MNRNLCSLKMMRLPILFHLGLVATTPTVLQRQLTTPSQFPQAVITTPPTLSDNPACRLVGTALYICESLTPTFTALDPTAQAPCLCYSSTSWVPEIFDSAVSLCVSYASTAVPESLGSVEILQGFCGRVGDVRISQNPRTKPVSASTTQTSIAAPQISSVLSIDTEISILTLLDSSISVSSSVTIDMVTTLSTQPTQTLISITNMPGSSSLNFPTTTSATTPISVSFQSLTTISIPATTSINAETTASLAPIPSTLDSKPSFLDPIINSKSFNTFESLSSSSWSTSSAVISSSMTISLTANTESANTESDIAQLSTTSSSLSITSTESSTISTPTSFTMSRAVLTTTFSSTSILFTKSQSVSKAVPTSTSISSPVSTSIQITQIFPTAKATPPGPAAPKSHPSSTRSESTTTKHSAGHSPTATPQASTRGPKPSWHKYEVILLSGILAMLSTFLILGLAILVNYVYTRFWVGNTVGGHGHQKGFKRITSLSDLKDTVVDYPSMI
ncbi:hypothetical protein BP5796_06903 [Coleophoma crateriformis]|uniref:Extracellular membrane protein CFEM domain-containing protein n=1 Tax=Coleophoma crateriformis TaxID=565419 RepID=A0A3D8RPS0_9HELO|nr:hypothetical protein BP5796_06903 [Coleophoma crateriformis]